MYPITGIAIAIIFYHNTHLCSKLALWIRSIKTASGTLKSVAHNAPVGSFAAYFGGVVCRSVSTACCLRTRDLQQCILIPLTFEHLLIFMGTAEAYFRAWKSWKYKIYEFQPSLLLAPTPGNLIAYQLCYRDQLKILYCFVLIF